ncbi:hypothetical protein CEXT_535961 [Caerostris extrusa]|uniref:Uncharacterized protein n=1 Tax=Caerostris extrusa TaxID=172846 RepID=A0AAV4QKB6_CAEEX|nr:hypothetical protein CEXT_535961 [Caerostris extrusa]
MIREAIFNSFFLAETSFSQMLKRLPRPYTLLRHPSVITISFFRQISSPLKSQLHARVEQNVVPREISADLFGKMYWKSFEADATRANPELIAAFAVPRASKAKVIGEATFVALKSCQCTSNINNRVVLNVGF